MRSISGQIAVGGTAQTLYDNQGMPYKGFYIRNNATTSSLWINENATAIAQQPSLEVKPGEMYESPPNCPIFTDPLSIFCSAVVAFTGRVW